VATGGKRMAEKGTTAHLGLDVNPRFTDDIFEFTEV
jgi:hypothetical protein